MNIQTVFLIGYIVGLLMGTGITLGIISWVKKESERTRAYRTMEQWNIIGLAMNSNGDLLHKGKKIS